MSERLRLHSEETCATPVQRRGLADWIDAAAVSDSAITSGLTFVRDEAPDEFHSYARLAAMALSAQQRLLELGLGPGDRVSILDRASPRLVAALFGAFRLGLAVTVLPHPFTFVQVDQYQDHVSHLIQAAAPRAVIVDPAVQEFVADLVQRLEPGVYRPVVATCDPTEVVVSVPAPCMRDDAELALIQFTSGSSGHPRPVGVSRRNLECNLAATREWLGWMPTTHSLTWLPTHHDMGLGSLIGAIVTGCPLWVIQPDHFVRWPERFLQTISDRRIALSAMPNFALALILRRVSDSACVGLDLGSLRSVVLGAERVDQRLLARFVERYAEYGLRADCLLPAYGGAEMTLAVSGVRPGQSWTSSAPAGSVTEVVGCGRPLSGVEVRIEDERGETLGDGEVGEIVIRGSSVSAGYLGDSEGSSRLHDGEFHSGDAGFLREGELFVIGRYGDGAKVNGQMVFAESVEADLVAAGVPSGRCVVALGQTPSQIRAHVLLVRPEATWEEIVREVLRPLLPTDADVRVHAIERQEVLTTTSGKPRRRAIWSRLERADGPEAHPSEILATNA